MKFGKERLLLICTYVKGEKESSSLHQFYDVMICKDKDEAEIWFVALRALTSPGHYQKLSSHARSNSESSDSSSACTGRTSPSVFSSSSSDLVYKDQGAAETIQKVVPFGSPPKKLPGTVYSDTPTYNAAEKHCSQTDFTANSLSSPSSGGLDNPDERRSADNLRISLSSGISSSSHGSSLDVEAPGDVFIWGEGICVGLLGGGVHRVGKSTAVRTDALLPKPLESAATLDAQDIACGSKHAVLLTKEGEVFSWGEGFGGRLGHGVEVDISYPKLISALCGLNTVSVACGEYHTCAVTQSGDLYTWGDGAHNFGFLGHGNDVGFWIPRKVCGPMQGIHVSSISCGPWHTAAVTMVGQLFTFGDGTFGALGHGDHSSSSVPRVVKTLEGLRTLKVSCGFWHTAAVVEAIVEPESSGSSTKKLFTWGSGDKGQLGHGDTEPRIIPSCVVSLCDTNFCQVACGHSITIALTTSGQVYTMGAADFGQLGYPGNAGKLPTCVEGKISNNFIEEISCGSHHVAVLSSKSEVYTWGKGANGQLGHGDNGNRNTPTLVEALRDKRVKNVVCGSNFTVAICLYKWVYHAGSSVCFGCRNSFNFRRKRHNCYNCGLVFCKACTSQKSLKASLAPNMKKPYRVCDECFTKINITMDSGSIPRIPRIPSGDIPRNSSEVEEKDSFDSKPQRLLYRLSSFDSFRRTSYQNSKQNRKSDSSGHTSPVSAGNVKTGSFYTSNIPVPSFPVSSLYARAASPVSANSSPPHSVSLASAFSATSYSEVIIADSNKKNDGLKEEIAILSSQVEDLTLKSQLLEAELERTTRQLKEAIQLAMEEADKNKAAKEVIKSLSRQLKDIAGKVPQDSSHSIKPNLLDETTSNPLSPSTWNHLTGKTFLEPYSDSQISGPIFLNGSSGESEKLDGDTECKSCP
ncbi:PH, RCC1 and FYVE domains-containing protein 1-like isoform X2 [Diospyros lotus]|uniref:PH, RCC1 and FYVE domains-containing protein 1-like isoform X2 n=1 Tax=Diospyros lotus TaxID=55363 RepID=UPI00224E1794|nr:PH, RCC1 and FYVE domains-containing protein 1-like isoform X2 [Diospyros lotus]